MLYIIWRIRGGDFYFFFSQKNIFFSVNTGGKLETKRWNNGNNHTTPPVLFLLKSISVFVVIRFETTVGPSNVRQILKIMVPDDLNILKKFPNNSVTKRYEFFHK